MRTVLFFIVLAIAGCAHAPVTPTGLKPEAFWQEQRQRLEATRQLSSKIYFRYESKKRNVGGQGRLVLQSPGGLRMELRDPLGRLQFLVTLHDQQFVARYPRQNLAYIDKTGGAAYLRRVLRVQVSFSELKDLLIGVLPESLKKTEFDSWAWDAERGVYVGTLKLATRKVEGEIDPQTGALRALRINGAKSSENVTVQYRDFGNCCRAGVTSSPTEFPLAHEVALQMQESGTTISVEWEDVAPFREAKPVQVFEAELPHETKRVELN